MRPFELLMHVQERLAQPLPDLLPVSGIFSYPPDDVSYPYITLQVESSRFHLDRLLVVFSLRLWSAYKGMLEIDTLTHQVQEMLLLMPSPQSMTLSLKQTGQQLSQDMQGVRCRTLTYQVHGRAIPPLEAAN